MPSQKKHTLIAFPRSTPQSTFLHRCLLLRDKCRDKLPHVDRMSDDAFVKSVLAFMAHVAQRARKA